MSARRAEPFGEDRGRKTRFARRQRGSHHDHGALEVVVCGGEVVVAAIVVDVVVLVDGAHVTRVGDVRASPHLAVLRARHVGRVRDGGGRGDQRRRRREDGGEEDREDEDEMTHRS